MSVELRTVDVATPGDVADRGDGVVAVADMTRGRVTLFPPGELAARAPRGEVIEGLEDVRSVAFHGDALLAACTFPRRVDAVSPSGRRSVATDLELPGWIDASLEGGAFVAEMAARRIRPLAFDSLVPARGCAIEPVPGAAHLSSFARDASGTIWVPSRPEPGLIEVSSARTTWHPLPEGAGELTGICLDASGRGLVLLDRTNACLWRRSDGRWARSVALGGFHRLRALRSHRAGLYAYSLTDPPTASVLWLDSDLRLRELWRGTALAAPPIVRTVLAGAAWLDLGESLAGPTVETTSSGRRLALPGQPRDLRVLPGGDLLVVLRDRHRVVRLDAALRARSAYGSTGELLYPCSADLHPIRGTVIATDPLRSRLVELDAEGSVRAAIKTRSGYVRWVRCAADGMTWTIDVAARAVTLYDERWTIAATVAVPGALDLAGVCFVEPVASGAIVLGGPGPSRWAVTREGAVSLDEPLLSRAPSSGEVRR